jgi:aspartokinase
VPHVATKKARCRERAEHIDNIGSIEVARRFNIPIHVRSSFFKEEGTMIVKEIGFSIQLTAVVSS